MLAPEGVKVWPPEPPVLALRVSATVIEQLLPAAMLVQVLLATESGLVSEGLASVMGALPSLR